MQPGNRPDPFVPRAPLTRGLTALTALSTLTAVTTAGFAAIMALATACTGGDGSGPRVWRFAIEEIEGSVQHAYAMRFEELIEERSGGAIEVEVYPFGSLGSSAQLTEQVQGGALQLAFASPGHLGSVVPEAQIFALHFLLSDDEAVNLEVLGREGEASRLLAEAYREHGLELLSIVPEGWMAWTANRPLVTPSDFEGLKLRTMVSPLLVDSYAAYGAQPTPMPYAEVYSGLQLGMIDAQVNPVFAIEEMSFYEVQSHLSLPRHAPFVTTLVTSPAFLGGLDAGERKLLLTTIDELATYIDETQRRFNAERLQRILEEGGTEVVELDDAQRAVFRELGLPVRETFIEMAGPRGKALLEAVISSVAEGEKRKGT